MLLNPPLSLLFEKYTMKLIAHIAMGMALGLGMVGATVAEPAQIKLPPEVAKLRTSKLPGYAIAMQKCSICHSADYVSYQPPGMSQAQWTAEMAKMQHTYGAPISDDEVKLLGAYLAVAYGSAKASNTEVVAASKMSVAVPMPPFAALTDAQVKALAEFVFKQ